MQNHYSSFPLHFLACFGAYLGVSHGLIDVFVENLPPRLYIPADGDYRFSLEPIVHADVPAKHAVNILLGWDNEPFEDGGIYSSTEPPFPRSTFVSVTLNWEGKLKIRIKVECSSTKENFQKDFFMQVFRLKAPVYASANPRKSYILHRYDPDDDHIRALVNTAVAEFSDTEKISFHDIVSAVSVKMPHEVERFFITVQCVQTTRSCQQGGYFLFGVLRSVISGNVNVFVETASPVPNSMYDRGPARPLAEWQQYHGRCTGDESAIDQSLSPWTRFGAKISREDVEALLHRNNKLCWQRVRIINNRLLVEQPEVVRLGLLLPNNEEEKWYTVCLVETLLTVLQHITLPDLDICISEELPQVFKGEGLPSLAMTRSHAHMDIVVPDFFFRYWNRTAGGKDVPHKWYMPAQDRSADSMAVSWYERSPKLWWRGTVASFVKGARGALQGHRPLRLVGTAVQEQFPGAEDLRGLAISPDGRGAAQDPDEPLRHRFLICTHGPHNHWSNRFRGLLSTGALVFKQEASLEEFWEDELIPFTHYIPVAEDLGDLIEKVEWALDNDEQAEAIAQAGVDFVRRRLTVERVLCYWARLLTAYAALLDYPPDPSPNATEYANLAVMVT